MSTPQPPRRRRIAGESKPAVTPTRPTPPAGRTPKVPVRRPAAPADGGGRTPTSPAPTTPSTPKPTTPKPSVATPTAAEPRRDRLAALRGLGRRLDLKLAVALLVMVAGLAAGVLGYQHMQRSMPLSYAQAQDAADAAATSVQTIFTYDYRDIEGYADATTGLVSPRYAEAEYDDLVEELGQQAVAAQAQMSTTVYAAATQPCNDDCSPDEARVLVVADRITLSAAVTEPVVSPQRLRVDLVRDGSRWLVDEVTYLGE